MHLTHVQGLIGVIYPPKKEMLKFEFEDELVLKNLTNW